LGGTPPDEGDFPCASTPSEPAAQTSSAFLRVIGERFSLQRRLYFPNSILLQRAAHEVSGLGISNFGFRAGEAPAGPFLILISRRSFRIQKE
jgi:hypothetical protein